MCLSATKCTANTTNHHHKHTPQHKHPHQTLSQHKRHQRRITHRAQRQREYHHYTPPLPLRRPGVRAPQHGPTKSLYTASLAALPHTGGYSPTAAATHRRDPTTATTLQADARAFKLKHKAPQNNATPNHLRTDSQPTPNNRQQWQRRHDMRQRTHTRAHWLKTHASQPTARGRTKHDIQAQQEQPLRGAFWNNTGLLES